MSRVTDATREIFVAWWTANEYSVKNTTRKHLFRATNPIHLYFALHLHHSIMTISFKNCSTLLPLNIFSAYYFYCCIAFNIKIQSNMQSL